MAEMFHGFGANIGDSIQFAALLLGIFAALAMYGIGVKVGSRTAGVVMAGAYLFLPYFHVNLYVRGNFMEYSAMTLLPVALWLIWRSIDDDNFRRVPAGCAGVAAFLLCHNVISMLGLPLLVAAGLGIIGFRARVSKWPSSENGALLRLALTLAGGIALAAWFIFPALIEMSYVHTSRLREGYLHFSNHFVTFRQLLFWPWGYGLSVPGEADQMSFMIGPVHLLIAAAGLVAVWRSRTLFALHKRLSAVLAMAALSAAFLTTELSRPVWNSLQLLQYAEFPWRALSVAGFCISILCGIWLLAVPTGRPRTWAAFLSLTILILFNLPNAQPSGFVRFDDEYYAPANIARLGMNTSTREEYEPAAVKRRAEYSINAMESLSCPFTFRYSPTVERPELRLFQVQSPSLCRVRVNLLSYPGWMVRIDGKPVPTLTEPEHGRILLDVPAGDHSLSIELTNTVIRQVSRLISLMTLISLIWLKWKTRCKGHVLEEAPKPAHRPLIDRPLCLAEDDGTT